MVSFLIEDQLEGSICGIDEVGRGPLAGPVVAACVIIPRELRHLQFISNIKDSKKLAPTKREELFREITAHFPYSIAEISAGEIDEINILQASLKAMKNAFETINHEISHALIDGNKAPDIKCKTTTVVKGDSKSKTIAAASIIAKVHRDRIMHKISEEYPYYAWVKNSGYPTEEHRQAILKHGISEHHRKSFSPVRAYIESTQ